MRDSPVTKLNEMPHNHIRTRRIINSHPRRRLLYLIINDYHRKALVIQARQILGSWAGEDRQQARCQLRCQHSIDNLAAIPLEVGIVDTVQHQLIRCLLKHLGHAAHQFGDKRPGKRRNQHADQLAAATRQPGSRDTWNEALLIDNAQNTFPSGRVYIGLIVQYTGDGGFDTLARRAIS